jgi:putative oxidoreductase
MTNKELHMFGKTTEKQIDLGLLVLRLALGTIFIAHGGQKLFVYGFEGVAGGFAQMGVPMASVVGPFIGFVELFGGIAIFIGLLTRLAGLGVASTMIGAISLVHLKNGFFNPGGIEFPLMLLASALAVVITGAGSYSIDSVIGRRKGVVTTSSDSRLRRAA